MSGPDFVADLFSFEGRVAVVTGSTRGIGFLIAKGLLQAGAREVIITSRKRDSCEAAAARLSEFGRVRAIPADLSTPEGPETLTLQLEDLDELHLLVNNAGAAWGAPLEEFPISAWDKTLNLNVRGVFTTTVSLVSKLRAGAREGSPARVVNIGSGDGIQVPDAETYSYSASKAAVHHLTRHLAKRLAAEQITVNAIAPGTFDTKMMAHALEDPRQREALIARVPMGRLGEFDDIVGLVLFLASRAGAYVTGAVIPLDGGETTCA